MQKGNEMENKKNPCGLDCENLKNHHQKIRCHKLGLFFMTSLRVDFYFYAERL